MVRECGDGRLRTVSVQLAEAGRVLWRRSVVEVSGEGMAGGERVGSKSFAVIFWVGDRGDWS